MKLRQVDVVVCALVEALALTSASTLLCLFLNGLHEALCLRFRCRVVSTTADGVLEVASYYCDALDEFREGLHQKQRESQGDKQL